MAIKRFLMVPLIAIILLSACNFSNSKVVEEKKVQNNNIKTKETSNPKTEAKSMTNESSEDNQMLDFGTKFNPPEFLVNKFDINVENGNELHLEITYDISPKLYKFLSKKLVYFFGIEFPQETFNITKLDKTSVVEGPAVEGNSKTYSLSFTEHLPVTLSQIEIEKLVNNKLEYKLYIFNKNKDPVHMFDDIELYSTTVPGKSDHTFIKDTRGR